MPPPDYAQSPAIDHRYSNYYDRGHEPFPSGGPNFYPHPGMGMAGERNRIDSSPNVMLQKSNIHDPMYEGGALSHIETPIGLKEHQHGHERHFHGERRIGGSFIDYGAGPYPQ